MCGIFALISNSKKDNAAQTVIEGLKKLEYRGYDSWGIAVYSNNRLYVDKRVGKISTAQTRLPQSTVGLGHTRWATHGNVTIANAHPFLDCSKQLALVHNGIIDNYLELKNTLKQKHQFKSKTDSEILIHLIEEYTFKGLTLKAAVQRAFKQAQGLNAILVLSQDQIIAAKTGSPLVVGIGKNKHFIASDLWSILNHTKKVVFLEDNQMAILGSQKHQFLDLKTGKQLSLPIKTIAYKPQKAKLKGFRHFMIKEIADQPEIISSLLVSKQIQTKHLAKMINKSAGTFFVACGTASFAALAGQYFFSAVAGKHTNPALGSEFIHYANFLTKKSLVIALSQSGETIDTIQSVQLAQKKQAQVASLVNVLGSTLYRLSNIKILLEAGPEKAVASTKAYTAKICLLLMTAGFLGNKQAQVKVEIKKAVKACRKILKPKYVKKLRSISLKLKNSSSIFVIGRGVSYPAALETALKIKEISYIHAEGLAGGELKHGPIALIEKNTPCIVIAPNDDTYPDTISGAIEIKARGGLIIGVSPKPHQVFDIHLKVEDCGLATIMPNVMVGQLLAYNLALARGLDPDKPRNLAKSVTVK